MDMICEGSALLVLSFTLASKKSTIKNDGIQIGTSYHLPQRKSAIVLKDVFQKYSIDQESKIHKKMFVR